MSNKHLTFNEMLKASYANPNNKKSLENFSKVQSHLFHCNECRKRYQMVVQLKDIYEKRLFSDEEKENINKFFALSGDEFDNTVDSFAKSIDVSKESMYNLLNNILEGNEEKTFAFEVNNNKLLSKKENLHIVKNQTSIDKNLICALTDENENIYFEMIGKNTIIIRSKIISNDGLIIVDTDDERFVLKAKTIDEKWRGTKLENIRDGKIKVYLE